MRAVLAVAAVTAVLAVDACGTERPAGGEGLHGRTFLSIAVDGRDLVEGTRIRARFADGELTAHAGCNHLSGSYRSEAGRLAVDGLLSTEIGCGEDRHAQDVWLAGLLTARPAVDLDGPHLALTHGDVTVSFLDRAVADPDRTLTGTRWSVTGLVDGGAAASAPDGAWLRVDDDGTFSGNTGCNSVDGTATAAGGTVTFADVVTTDVACAGPAAELEAAVLAVLDGAVTWQVEASALTLTHPSGRGLTLRASSSSGAAVSHG